MAGLYAMQGAFDHARELAAVDAALLSGARPRDGQGAAGMEACGHREARGRCRGRGARRFALVRRARRRGRDGMFARRWPGCSRRRCSSAGRDRAGERDVRAEPGARDRRRRRDARRCGVTSAEGCSAGRTPLPRESGSRARRWPISRRPRRRVPDRGPDRTRRDVLAAGAPPTRRASRSTTRASSPRKRAAS